MQRPRRRYLYLLIYFLLLLCISRGRFAGRSPAQNLRHPAEWAIVKADAHRLPRWQISDEDFRELLELFSQRFFSREDRSIEELSFGSGGIESDVLPAAASSANPPQVLMQQYALDQEPILFWPASPAGGTIGPSLEFSPFFAPEFPRGSLSGSPSVPPPLASQIPPAIGQPATLPEPMVSLPLATLLICLRRRT